jgi:hypothetical protein
MTLEELRDELEELMLSAQDDLAPADILTALEEQCEVCRGMILKAKQDEPQGGPPAADE